MIGEASWRQLTRAIKGPRQRPPRITRKSRFLEDYLMSDAVKVGFVPFSTAPRGILVAFCDDALKLGPVTRKILGKARDW